MAATVKPIEASAVHRIQAGQVIVDLCSVVKELVENSLDAGASILEVRFKNNGLDEIEVQDNGSGIAPSNYESVALKHYTSKLSTYDDLESLSTFGFRGEALSSLCSLSHFLITTAMEDEAPKGHRLEFDNLGKLKSTSLVASQRGTTATVAGLFENLPVRRKELTKNIKREYGKVIGLLHAYACISTNVKFTVKSSLSKGKSTIVFSTQSNRSTRDNIANVYGTKTLSALASLDLKLQLEPTNSGSSVAQSPVDTVIIRGHISKPVFGEGRSTPDRQMFFVNGRPCGLPQIAKAINEVYKQFNVSQSPFIFADLQMDTKAYDVNVSPDKRSIFLHNASALIDSLKAELTSMFDDHDQTLPHANLQLPRTPAYKQIHLQRTDSTTPQRNDTTLRKDSNAAEKTSDFLSDRAEIGERRSGIGAPDSGVYDSGGQQREASDEETDQASGFEEHLQRRGLDGERSGTLRRSVEPQLPDREGNMHRPPFIDTTEDQTGSNDSAGAISTSGERRRNRQRMGRSRSESSEDEDNSSPPPSEPDIPAIYPPSRREPDGIVESAFDRMRPRRLIPEIATITIGNRTVTRMIHASDAGSTFTNSDTVHASPRYGSRGRTAISIEQFSQKMGQFSASGPRPSREIPAGDDNESSDGASSIASSEPAEISQATKHMSDGSSPESRSSKNQMEPRIDDSDEDDRTEEAKRVAQLIRAAEESRGPDVDESKRVLKVFRGSRSRDSTFNLQAILDCSLSNIELLGSVHQSAYTDWSAASVEASEVAMGGGGDDEERLSLTVSKSDFSKMAIVGQFNLGFILAVRVGEPPDEGSASTHAPRDELFIIDQHASDEKYNFERLQAETVVGNQRMVRPVTLDLTAVEEEILIESGAVLEKNGFLVDVDLSGERPVGQRCQLVSLPLSKEVVFNTRDLDELVHLLSDTPLLSESRSVPRPSKVRKMFAMRACRSSIMIGKTLSRRQMATVVQHMGTIDKPWNCPHGRPTMRHLASLDRLDARLWQEGDGLCFGHEGTDSRPSESDWESVAAARWRRYAAEAADP